MYQIFQKLCAKAGYFTPDEARKYYGRYARDGVTVHWWGDGTGESNHDNIVNYIYNQSVLGNKSVNYVLSDAKITLMVGPDDVAWTSQSGNATTVSVETEPQLSDEGYKKWGWLLWQLEQRYGKTLKLYPHNYWYSTACPGSISLDRIRQEQIKWARGDYNPAPVTPEWKKNLSIIAIKKMYAVDDDTPLFNLESLGVIKNFTKATPFDIKGQTLVKGAAYLMTQYSVDNSQPNGFRVSDLQDADPNTPPPDTRPEWLRNLKEITAVKLFTLTDAKLLNLENGSVVNTYPLDTPMDIKGETTVAGKHYFLTAFSYDNKKPNGFLTSDLKTAATPPPQPEPEKPEWVTNLRDIDDTKFWLVRDQELIDITTGKPTGTATLKKDSEFVCSALTVANGVEYRITDYSFKKGIFNGVPIGSLTLTEPGEPDVPPEQENPDLVSKSTVIAFLEGIMKLIAEFIKSLRS